jgi:hypothetical protein
MNNGTYLTKEAILAADDLGFEDVSVPEWGGVVRVREMTAADRESLNRAYQNRDKAMEAGDVPESIQALLVGMCIVDGAGNRLFSDDEIAALGRKSSNALQRVWKVAAELSALKPEAIGELAKNSGTSTSEDSPSA